MMKVTIEVNGRPIGEATAVNRGHADVDPDGHIGDSTERLYELDDGSFIVHDRTDGAAALAKRVIDRMDLEPELTTVTSETNR